MPQKIRRAVRIFLNDPAGNCLPRSRAGGVPRTFVAACALLSMAMVCEVKAQNVTARISVVSTAPAWVHIDAQLAAATSTVSFLNSYAGILGLGERIQTIEGFGVDGAQVQIRKLAPGEFRASQKFSRLSYEVNLALPLRPAHMSHVSWLNADHGLLMMADLLPQRTDAGTFSAAVFSFVVPAGWSLASNVNRNGSQFSSDDPDTAAFLLGRSLNEKRQRLGTRALSVVSSGNWPFANSDLIKTSVKILQHYSRITGFNLRNNAMLMLLPYAGDNGPENWTAETRGNVVVLLLGNHATKKKVLSRIGVVLSHEMFHLWVPNSLRLTGDYDWFFEGFTLYEALRTDLRLGFISFGDYLDTIARVYDSYMSATESRRFSLIEAAERRWTTQSSLVYDKGMLVAFLYDLTLRKATDCKASLEDVYAELFQLPPTGQKSANETIIRVLTKRAELKSFAHDNIETASMSNFEPILSDFGMVMQPGPSTSGATQLSLARDLNQTQRTRLGCLGYRK